MKVTNHQKNFTFQWKLVKATTELHDLGPKNRKLAIEFAIYLRVNERYGKSVIMLHFS